MPPREIPTSAEQNQLWDDAAGRKRFTHPLRLDWVTARLSRGAHVLDLGTGYGRLLPDLLRAGFAVAAGERSHQMVERARQLAPQADIRVTEATLPWPDGHFACVLMVALLTSLPRREEQRSLMAEVSRVLAPEGLLYLSDLPLQWDARNLERYQAAQTEFGEFGVFRTRDGIVVRHHSVEDVLSLLDGFSVLEGEPFEAATMDGNRCQAFRFLAGKE